MKEQRVIFPKTTPQWLRERVRAMENQIEELEREHERTRDQLGKNQEDFQDLLDLVEQIAKEETIDRPGPWALRACRDMANRFNPGSYKDVNQESCYTNEDLP